ncbi:MAG TPA: hypothetical protein VGP72_27630 [Planctomycetota bacterium]|jgi:hypothetical protein
MGEPDYVARFLSAFTVGISVFGAAAAMVIIGPTPLSPLLLWPVAPYVGAAALALLCRKRRFTSVGLLAASIWIGLLGSYAYFDLFHAHLDPQSGVGLVFVPMYQFAIIGVLLLIGTGVDAVADLKKKRGNSG